MLSTSKLGVGLLLVALSGFIGCGAVEQDEVSNSNALTSDGANSSAAVEKTEQANPDILVADNSTEEKVTDSAEAVPSFYTVAHYDKQQEPAKDLAATLERAKAENKRVLIQVGGEWCIWCKRMSEYMKQNESVHALLDESYLVMKLTYPGNNAEAFLKDYPKPDAYPFLYVVEQDGTLLHAQPTGVLEEDSSYSEAVFIDFLKEWQAE